MSWFSKGIKKVGTWAKKRVGDFSDPIGGIKSSVKGTGKFATSDAGKAIIGTALAATGVGAPAAALWMGGSQAAGSLAAGKNIGESLKSGVVNGVTSYGVGHLARELPGVGSVTNKLGMSGANGATKSLTPGVMQALGDAGGALAGGGNMGLGSSLGNIAKKGVGTLVKSGVKHAVLGDDGKFGFDDIGRGIKKVGSFAMDNPDLLLAAGSAYEGINASNDASKYRDRALAMAEQDAASRGQFRNMAMTRLGGASRPDLGSLFAGSGNPYAQAGSVPRVGGGAAPGNLPPRVMGEPTTAAGADAAMQAFKQGGPLLSRVGRMVNAKRLAEAA